MRETASEQRGVDGPNATDRTIPLGAAINRWMDRYALLWFAGLLALCVAGLLLRSAGKWLWYDELLTLNMAQQNTFARYWSGLAADAQPPLGSCLAWVCVHLFGPNAFALRLPSMLAYLAATVLVYRIVSIRLGRVAGLLATVLFNTNPLVSVYAIEARPYALVLLFTVAAFASWQLATDEQHPRTWAKWAIMGCIAGGVLSHHYGILNVGLPLLAGEIARSIHRRRIDWPLAACAFAGLLPLALTVPLMQRTQRAFLQYSNLPRGLPPGLTNPLHAADYDSILAIDNTGFAKLVLLLLVLLLLQSWWKERQDGTRPDRTDRIGVKRRWTARFGWPTHELVALVASTLSLITVFLVSSMGHVFFSRIRYGIGTFFGVVVLLTTLFALFDTQVQAMLVLLLSWPLLKLPTANLHTHAEPPESACLRAMPQVPIVVADTMRYPPYWYYADPALRARLFYLLDKQYALKQRYTTPELVLLVQKPIFPMNLADYDSFIKTHSDFLVMVSGEAVLDYQADHLKESGYHLTPLTVAGCSAGKVFEASR